MAPPMNEPGNPPDVAALIVPMVTGVTHAQRDSREMAARSVLLV